MYLTEKLESNSKPMKIHISQPCKDLLPPQYKTEERTGEPELREKVREGGWEGRQCCQSFCRENSNWRGKNLT